MMNKQEERIKKEQTELEEALPELSSQKKEAPSVDDIRLQVEDWTFQNISKNFVFRKGQLEYIVYIINNIINRTVETTILQMPTGSGKSLTCIIAAGVLSAYYNKKSYILASDLYLWQQYADAIKTYKLRNFGYLKGSIGNYWCDLWHTDYNLGKCKVEKISINNLRNKDWRRSHGWSCADTCVYMKERFRAERAPVSLLTYQLWLYQMNLVEHTDNLGFLKRDVIFCDECHNIPDIVSMYSQPVIDVLNDRQKLVHIIEYALENDIRPSFERSCMRPDTLCKLAEQTDHLDENARLGKTVFPIKNLHASDYYTVGTVMKNFDYFVDCLHIASEIDHRLTVKFDILLDFHKTLKFINNLANDALDEMSKADTDSQMSGLTKKEQKERLADFKILSWMHNYESAIACYIDSIGKTGDEYAVFEEVRDRVTGNISYTLSCVKEDFLCHNFLMKNSRYKVMLSATVGDKTAFYDNIGIKYSENPTYEFSDMPSNFSFEKSPIYFVPKYKMSYQNKKYDFPMIRDMVYQILSAERFKDKHGMINTGSYENAKFIYDSAPPAIKKRLCMYISSKDKLESINNYKKEPNRVLIGPTLVEGVDLPDDLCRFIIIVKIPYPNISSKTVKAKMSIFPKWYDSTTSNTVIQNIGRGVRNENDYCETFILDGCFQRLYEQTYWQYPEEIRNRIKVI